MEANDSNHLMDTLPLKQRLRLRAACEPVELALAATLCTRGAPMQHAYFPTGSFISLICSVDHHPGMEVGMVGSEGMVGMELLLGAGISSFDAVVQGAGTAWRIDALALCAELKASPPLRQMVSRCVHIRLMQLGRAAGCQRFHAVAPRLARWLLVSQDHAQGGPLYLTHEFISNMLGVRRSGVTTAAGLLQRQGLIRYSRGALTVLDRRGLKQLACSCYEADRVTNSEGRS